MNRSQAVINLEAKKVAEMDAKKKELREFNLYLKDLAKNPPAPEQKEVLKQKWVGLQKDIKDLEQELIALLDRRV